MKGKITFLAILIMFLSLSVVKAQSTSQQATVIPMAGHDTSIELKNITPHIPAGNPENVENEQEWGEDPFGENFSQPPANDPVIQGMKGTKGSKGAAINFAGLSNDDNGSIHHAPPDTDGDIGPNHYFQTVNTSFEIFDRDGNSLYGPAGVTTIFDGFTGQWTGLNVSDPVVLYDEQADRWFFSVFTTETGSTSGLYYILVAVSQSADPTGSYYRYAYGVSAMPDYAKWAVWPNGYFMGANVHSGYDIFAFERSQMLLGNSAGVLAVDNSDRPNYSGSFQAVLPADCDGTFPPSSTPAYFVTINDDAWPNNSTDRLMIWEFSVNWSPQGGTWSLVQSINTAAFDTYFTGGFHDNIEQPGTSQKLDAISQILMHRVQYRYIGGQGRIVCNHTVDVGSDHAGIRWYELRKTGSNPWTKYQESTYAPDADNRWMGSIAMNGNGDIALGYTVSGSSTYPSIRFTGRNYGDALNSMTIMEQSIQTGAYSQTTGSRWGDYSSMRVDPNDGQTFWYTSEYVESSSGWYPWATRVAAFNFNSYCAASGSNCGSTDEYISRVQFGEIDNQTGCDHYTDYSITQANEIAINAAEDITVTNGSTSWSDDQCGIWVDWNQDNDFDDAGEAITVSGSPGTGPYTASIDPPSTVSVGDEFIMRVRIVYNATPTPCGTTSYGEVEDYKITIGDMVPNEWTGAFNHYWHNANNWSLGHIPTADEDVIITSAGYQPATVSFYDEACNNLTVNSGASLDIKEKELVVNNDIEINGELKATDDDAVITCFHDVIWNNGSTANFTNAMHFWVYGDWNFNAGSNAQLSNGWVYFRGSSTSWIRSYSTSSSFNSIVPYKSSSASTFVSALSTEDLTISGNIIIEPGSPFGSYSQHKIILKGSLSNYEWFDFALSINPGTFVFDGTNQSINMYSTGGTFNNVIFSSTSTTSTTGDFVVKGDLTIESGEFSLEGHKISIEGNWNNNVGDAGFYESGRVVFNGTSHQYTTSEHFDTLEIANGAALRPFSGNAYNIVCDHYDWTSGGIDIVPGGSTFTANDLIDNGIYGGFWLNPGGTINLTNNDGYVDLNGDLHIFGGTMNVYGGTSYSYWPFLADASITMSDGILDFHDQGIRINNSSSFTLTENITGGIIRTSQGFSGNRSDFTPTAGTFEFYGTSDCYLFQSNGCTLFNVNIDKGSKSASTGVQGEPIFDERSKTMVSDGGKSNTSSLNSDFVITNHLTITSGNLTLSGNTLSVAHSCDVYGTLTMNNAADILNVGTIQYDMLLFADGSVGNISNGVINLPYALWLDTGSSFVAGTDNTIYFGNTLTFGGIFNGSSNTIFGNIIIDMLPGYKWILDNTSTAPFVVNGDFTVMSNNVVEMLDQTLIINGNLSDVSSSAIYVYDGPVKGSYSLIKEGTGQGSSKAKGGYLELNNDFTLNGLMDIGPDGTVLAHGHFESSASGVLTISGGSLTCDVADGISHLYGTYNISDGLLEYTDSHIGYYGTSNITGGTLRAGRTVFASDDGLQADGGIFEFTGSKSGNYIKPGANTYLNDLLFNKTSTYTIYPPNTANPLVVKGDVTINSGTLSTNGNDMFVGGNWNNNSGSGAFNETTGTVTFNEAVDVTVSGETFYNLILDKPSSGDWLTLSDDVTVLNDLDINGGALHTGSNILDVSGNAAINAGTLFVQAGGTLKIGDNKTLSSAIGSHFYIEGNSSNYATLTHSGTGHYNTELHGETAAVYAIFEYMGANGIFIAVNGTINPVYTFNHCIFQNGYEGSASLSAYLRLDGTNTFTSVDAYFGSPTADLKYNVWKTVASGHATFQAATGDFAGAEHENDWADLVDWTDVDIEMSLTVMLEGPYNGTDMNTDLNNLGLIPLDQPFSSNSSADWYYTGTESVSSIPTNVVDWVLVQIRSASDAASALPGTVVAQQAAFLLNDGSVVDLDGSSNLYFSGINYSSGLFPVVWHRNHLGIISADKMTRTGGIYTYDFTQAGASYSNTNAGETDLGGGVYGMWGGDGNGSGWVYDTQDLTVWRNYAGETDNYYEGNFDLNGQIDNKDKNDIWFDSYDMRSQIPGSKDNSGDDKN